MDSAIRFCMILRRLIFQPSLWRRDISMIPDAEVAMQISIMSVRADYKAASEDPLSIICRNLCKISDIVLLAYAFRTFLAYAKLASALITHCGNTLYAVGT